MCFPFLRIAARWLAFATLLLTAASCTPNIDYRGYLAKPGAFAQIQEGMAKSEVEATLGSPSTTASVNFHGDSYYYISSVTEQKAFMNPTEIKREVIAIRFNTEDRVASFGQYGLEDGRIIDMNSRKTPTKGREFSVLQQIFGNLGKPGEGGSIIPGRSSNPIGQ